MEAEHNKKRKKNPKTHSQLNPNWAQLQLKLKTNGFNKSSERTNEPEPETKNSILGKRKERPETESDDFKLHPLTPTNDDFSGIRPRDLRKAKDFRVVQKKVAELIEGRILVGHALHNDFKALLLTHPKENLRDTSEYLPFLKEGRRKSLRHLASEFLGVEIQNGEHCSVEDARAAMMLYLKNRKQWEKSAKDQIRHQQKQMKRKPKRKPKKKEALNFDHAATAS